MARVSRETRVSLPTSLRRRLAAMDCTCKRRGRASACGSNCAGRTDSRRGCDERGGTGRDVSRRSGGRVANRFKPRKPLSKLRAKMLQSKASIIVAHRHVTKESHAPRSARSGIGLCARFRLERPVAEGLGCYLKACDATHALSPFTTAVKSDHCSTRKARISRTDFGNHARARRD